MPICPICGEHCTFLPQHTFDVHSTPPAVEINGVLTEIHRAEDDNALICPVEPCTHRYARCSGVIRHIKGKHGHVKISSSEKRPISSSLESLSDGVHKKTKLVAKAVSTVMKSV